MKKQMLILAVTLMMVFGAVLPALAQTGIGTLVLTGGTLSVVPAPISFVGFTLDGTAHNNVGGTTDAWIAKDPTGTGAGWHMTVEATVPTNAASKVILLENLTITLPDTSVTMTDTITTGTATKPTSSITNTNTTTLEAVRTIVVAQPNTGMGTYSILPTFNLVVPAATYAGTYTTTMTVAILTTP